MLSKKQIIDVLGKNIVSLELQEFIGSLNSTKNQEELLPGEEVVLTFNDVGLSLLFEDQFLSAIHGYLITENTPYKAYSGWLGDERINQGSSLVDIEKYLGKPILRGGGEIGFMGKIDDPWIRYDYPNLILHYTFLPSGKGIKMVTFMPNQ